MADDLAFLHGSHRPCCIATVSKRFGYHTFQLMARGAVELSYGSQDYELRGAWTWPCHPGPWIVFHELPRGRPWDHRYVAFTGARVATWEADGLWPTGPQPVPPDDLGGLALLFDQVIDLAASPGRWARLHAVNLLERILLERAEGRYQEPPTRPAWLSTVLQQLTTLEADLDYDALARSVTMSPSTLRRRFRAVTGQSMHQYRLEHRVAQARHLLGANDEPIKVIASRLGYRDVFYFTRQFAQFTGVSPAAYRRSRQ